MKKMNKKFLLLLLLIPLIIFFMTLKTTHSFIFNINKDNKLEGTEEIELDNWEISTVFYDSTVNNGKTPLTEINWDASNGGYGQGQKRIISVQITYKNSNCIKDYGQGELSIVIPKLYNNDSKLTIVATSGANDETHTGYDWNVDTNTNSNLLIFTNVTEFSEHSNFEGTIKILYELIPNSESPEVGLDNCIHTLQNNIKAMIIPTNQKEKRSFYYNSSFQKNFSLEDSEYDFYKVYFDSISTLDSNMTLNFESSVSNLSQANNQLAIYNRTNYGFFDFMKIITEKEVNVNKRIINGSWEGYKSLATSNTITFNYSRTYTHVWNKYNYKLTKTAKPLTYYDGLKDADKYIWVEYTFSTKDYPYNEYYGLTLYSKDKENMYIYDDIPENCVVYHNGSIINPFKDSTYRFPLYINRGNAIGNFIMKTLEYKVVVGYPKSVYNTENNNLEIVNSADLYVKHLTEQEHTYQSSSSVELNLADYQNINLDTLYGITKSVSTNHINSGTSICGNCFYTNYYQSIAESDTFLTSGNLFAFNLYHSIKYTGKPLTVKYGDDYLTALNSEGKYEKITDDDYHFNTLKIQYIVNSYSASIVNKYNWKLYVRKANNPDYELYAEHIQPGNITFKEDEKIVEYYIYAEDVEDSILMNSYAYINFHKEDINQTGTLYNYSFQEIFVKDENNNLILQNPSNEKYPNNKYSDNIADYDLEKYNHLVQRASAGGKWYYYDLVQPTLTLYTNKAASKTTTMLQDEGNQIFTGSYDIYGIIETKESANNRYNPKYKDKYNDAYRIGGFTLYDLLPLGMDIDSTKEEIIASLDNVYSINTVSFYDEDFNNISRLDLINQYIKPNLKPENIEIQNNYNGTGRTRLVIKVDFGERVFFFNDDNDTSSYSDEFFGIKFNIKVKVHYSSFEEYGNTYGNTVFAERLSQDSMSYKNTDIDSFDVNGNNNITERLPMSKATLNIISVVSTNQDVQVSAISDKSNYNTNLVDTSNDSDYIYKLRVRTGQNDVTNLVIYDSLEDYAKDPNLEIIKASGGKKYWQGEFLGIDTSYAASKGYNVKVYYSEESKPGSLKEDNTWQEYNDSVDKSKVKSLAFEYLDSEGNPAILPANSLTYVLVNMKSPSEELKTFAYNGCWTEWNAIDPATEKPVDFITGINSNIVKVALPTSVELANTAITIQKKWNDNNNSLNIRPDNIILKLVANDDYANATDIPLSGTGNTWETTLEVPLYDDGGEDIEYKIIEDAIKLDNSYKYVADTDGLTITNKLYKEITLTKIWKDNTNAYLTRPSNVSFNILQNNNSYKTITFGGNLTDNEWTETISVPVFDENGNEYTYSIEEVTIDNYSSTCEEFTCTNLLTDEDTIKVKKEWLDNDNSYNTRPDSITIKLKQNNSKYKDVTLTGDTNTWESDEITVPMYDENGVKYSYSIEEPPLEEYGLVEYNQSNYTITNTLKKNISITITKKWIDDNNALELRPDELKVTLLQNNEIYQELTLTGEESTWSTTIEVPKYDDNQIEYTYSIKELTDNLNEDYSNITYSEDELAVTNKLQAKTNITITKTWDDGDNELKTRPESIKVNLLRDGELLEELEIKSEDINENTWSITVEGLDVYDSNGKKYNYTIEENLSEQLERYETITYDQTNLTITNKLTIPPKVTLFFTVKNGYTLPGLDEIKYDEEGYKNVLSNYDLNSDDEYIFHFELENVDTKEIIEGKLSTQGTLEFDNVPYGTYRAREGEDKYFSFVSMVEIEEVKGVTFTEDEMGGTITIVPTGKDITYGANIINKIEQPVKNPNTKSNNKEILITLSLLLISIITFIITIKSHHIVITEE